MAYSRINWQNNVTPLNAENLNAMDRGIESAHSQLEVLRDIGENFDQIKTTVNNLEGVVKASFDKTTGTLKLGKITKITQA